MILDSIKLKNFRQYMDENIIEFSKSDEKSFTIIRGTNGAGKTTILNAITWCLYGEELHNITDDPIYNEITENITDAGGKFNIEVEIEMLNENNETTTFKRVQQFYKDENGKIFESFFEGSDFSIIEQSSKDNKIVQHPELFIDKHMPADIEEYFFFNGQRLEDYFKENTGKVIKKSVFKITQLELFRRLIDHLDEHRRGISAKIEDISPKIGALEQQIIDKENSIVKNGDLLKAATKQIKIAEDNIDKFEKKLKKTGSSDIDDLVNERENLDSKVDELDVQIDEAIEERVNFLLKMCPIICAYPALEKTKEITSKLYEKKFIPVKYKKQFIEDLLEEGVCICGTDLEQNEECKNKILELKDKTSLLTNIGEEISSEHALLGTVLGNLADFREKQKKLGKNLKWLENEREEKSIRVKEIGVQLKDSEIENIRRMEEFLDDNKKILKDKIREETVLSRQIKSDKELISKLKAERNKEMAKNKEMKKHEDELQFCEKALEAARSLKSDLIEDIREKIELETKEQFSDLNWKKKTFINVLIDDDYNVKVLRRSGRYSDASGLSAGEKLALALAFMAALNKISGFNLPIVIDTPMGILDREIKLNIAEMLPNYLRDKQISLLVTGEEYSDEFKKVLVDRVGAEYYLKLTETDEGNKTEVVRIA